MKKTFLAIVLALVGVLAFAQERSSIAVFPFEDMDNLLTKNESVLFYRNFNIEFANQNNNRFRIVPRQDVEKLFITEYNFQLTRFSAKTITADMNTVLNGSRILSGYIGRLGNKLNISISLYTYPELEQLPGGVNIDVANKEELFTKIPELVQSMMTAIAGGGTIPPVNNPAPVASTYKIGDTGPAGGIIFYDRGFTGDGWRYLEAAPAGSEFTAQWGAYDTNIANTMTAVGFGKQNTKIIIDRLQQLGEINTAAQLCAVLDVNGYKDWFLPSLDELDLMFNNLKKKGLGGFGDKYYWSSSHGSQSKVALYKSFTVPKSSSGNGWIAYGPSTPIEKDSKFNVRAIRAF